MKGQEREESVSHLKKQSKDTALDLWVSSVSGQWEIELCITCFTYFKYFLIIIIISSIIISYFHPNIFIQESGINFKISSQSDLKLEFLVKVFGDEGD